MSWSAFVQTCHLGTNTIRMSSDLKIPGSLRRRLFLGVYYIWFAVSHGNIEPEHVDVVASHNDKQ